MNSKSLKEFFYNRHCRIGILGGSFNPAHWGHVRISLDALMEYDLDYIIWMVAHQNPYKPKYENDIFARAKQASLLLKEINQLKEIDISEYSLSKKIIVSTIEHETNSYETYDSLIYMQNIIGKNDLRWIMGGDNVDHFYKWKRSDEIVNRFGVILFSRNNDKKQINLKNELIHSLKLSKSKNIDEKKIFYYNNKDYDISSTRLRENKNTR